MPERELAILLKARNMASGPIKAVNKDLSTMEKTGRRVGTGLRTLGGNLKTLGVGAAAGIAIGGIAAIRSGLESLAERENVISATEAAIKATGGAAKVSAAQVRTWAEELETATGAAVDDKAIQAAATSLIRFGTIGEKEFKRTLAAATDLGAGMKKGPEAGAKMLGIALSDPVKGMAKLRKAGIILTAAEEKRIKQLVAGNKVQEAQGVILAAVEKRYKGAAAASAGPYTRALNLLADASEDAKMALAEGFLPILTKVASTLSKAVADPQTIKDIRGIGQSLAGAFQGALDGASKIPWDSIKSAMQTAGMGAKAAFSLFTGLPPWVQTAVLTGWGLNKLTGGAITGVIGELGKGLIKGVLGMNAGVVNIKAGVVTGVGGGVPGGAPVGVPAGAPGAKPGVTGAIKGLVKATIVGAVAVEGGQLALRALGSIDAAADENNRLAALGLTKAEVTAQRYYNASASDQQTIAKRLMGHIPSRADLDSGTAKLSAGVARVSDASTRTKDDLTAVGLRQVAASNATMNRIEASRITMMAGLGRTAAAAAAAGAVAKSGGLAAAAASDRAATAIRNKDLSVSVKAYVNTSVSVRSVIGARTLYGQYQKTSATTRTQF